MELEPGNLAGIPRSGGRNADLGQAGLGELNPTSVDHLPDGLEEAVSLILAMMPVVRTIKARAGSCQLNGMSITARHMQVLMHLLLVDKETVSELADQLKSSLASTSMVVSQLATIGLVERHEDPGDHRRTVVHPGPEYPRFVVDTLVDRFHPLLQALQGMDVDDRLTLERLLRTLSANVIGILDA